jgi:gluconolactonase
MASRLVGEGLGITEGPIVTADGRLFVTSVTRGLIYEVFDNGRDAIVAVETGGGPNGMTIGSDGLVYITQNGGVKTKPDAPQTTPGIQRWDTSSGRVEFVLDEGCDAPNDLVFGPDGRLWFTDPPGSPFDDPPPLGTVKALDLVSGAVEVMLSDLVYPNGLAFATDHALVVAETSAGRLTRFPNIVDGSNESEVFAELGDRHPDGMAFDPDGILYVATTHANAVVAIDAKGIECGRVTADGLAFVTNVAFIDDVGTRLIVTGGKKGRVFVIDL